MLQNTQQKNPTKTKPVQQPALQQQPAQQQTKAQTLQEPPAPAAAPMNLIAKTAISAFQLFALPVIIFLFLLKKGVFSGLRSQKDNVDTEKGSAHFADRSEVKHLLKAANQPPPAGELLIGEYAETSFMPWRLKNKNLVLNRNLTSRHVLIAAPTGAGKSATLFLPNLVFPSKQSALITDVKSELWNYTSGFQTNPVRFAPMEKESASFNWIPLCKDIRIAARCAEAIAYAQGVPKSDPYWINGELRILTAIFSHCAHSDEPLPTHAYELLNTDVDVLADVLKNSPSENARRASVKFAKAKDEHKNSFTDAAANKMTWMEDPNIRRFTSSTKEAFDFGQLRHKPTQVYWCLKQTDVTGLKALTTLFFNLAILQLLDESGKIPVTFFLDEFANVGRLNNFESDITLLRGQNIAVVAGLQDRSQLDTLYGKSQATTILSQFNNVVLLAGLKEDTAEMFSKLLGEFTYTDIRTSRGSSSSSKGFFNSSSSSNESYYTSQRRLLTTDELRRMPLGENILISTNLAPIRLKAILYDTKKHPENKAKLNEIGVEMNAPTYTGDEPKQLNAALVSSNTAASAAAAKPTAPPAPKRADFINKNKPEQQPEQEEFNFKEMEDTSAAAAVAAAPDDYEDITIVKQKRIIRRVEKLNQPDFTVEDLHDNEPLLSADQLYEQLEEANNDKA
jgi:type IV secretion system protein VirD4